MKSLAVTFSGFWPRTRTFTVSGTAIRTSFVIHELKMAVVPTPKATQPTAPAWGVWESLPMITWPGSAWPSRIFEWQIASEPWWPSRSSPYSLIPCFSANARCFFSSCRATSRRPSLTRSGGHGLAEEGEVITEHEDRSGIMDLLVLADELLEEDRRHGRDVLVAEADV